MGKDYTDVLLEEMNGKFDLLLEAVTPLLQMQQDMHQVKEDIVELKSDMKVVKVAVTDTSKQVVRHEKELLRLKRA